MHGRILAAWLLAGAAACGDAPPPGAAPEGEPAPFRRVALTPESPRATEPLRLAAVTASEGEGAWKATAPEVRHERLQRPDGSQASATVLVGEGQLKYVRGVIPEAARSADVFAIEARVGGGGQERIRLYLFAAGEPLVPSQIRDVPPSEGVQLISFEVPELRAAGARPDEFGVAFEGKVDVGAVVSVTFFDAPTAAFAPPQSGDGELVRIGESFERSLALMPGSALVGAPSFGQDDELRVTLGLHPTLAREGEALRVRVTVEGASHRVQREVSLTGGDPWRTVRVTSSEVGVGPGSLRIEVESSADDQDALGLVGIPTVRRAARAGEAPPTVLLITSDTHRADHLGILGPDAPVSTPHLDALAQRGILFTNCTAQTNVTNPSHIALMTGVHPRDTGVLTNLERLADSAQTLAETFRAAGYETVAAMSAPQLLDDRSGMGQGFDRMNGPRKKQRPGPEAVGVVADWLDDAGGAPLFAWLHVYDAHAPYSPPAPYSRRYYGKDRSPFEGEPPPLREDLIPKWAPRLKDLDFPYAEYRAEVDFVDGSLARVLDHPRARDAAIAFTADHGELFGEHGIWWSHSGLYPGILRVPLIIAFPGAPRGARSDQPVLLTDVGATLLCLSGLEPDLPGRDLARDLVRDLPSEPRFALGAHHYSASIEADGWFLTMNLKTHFAESLEFERAIGRVELYDLTSDPDCEIDVLLEELPRAKTLRAALLAWLEAAPAERWSEAQQRTEADETLLRELGYASGGDASRAVRYWDPESEAGAAWQDSPWRKLFE